MWEGSEGTRLVNKRLIFERERKRKERVREEKRKNIFFEKILTIPKISLKKPFFYKRKTPNSQRFW